MDFKDWDPSKLLDTIDGPTFVAMLDRDETQKWLEKTMTFMMRHHLEKLSVPRQVLAYERLLARDPAIRRDHGTDLILYDRDNIHGYDNLIEVNLHGEATGVCVHPRGWSLFFQQTRTERLTESAEKIEALGASPAFSISVNMVRDLADSENKQLFKLTESAAATAATFIRDKETLPRISRMVETDGPNAIPVHGTIVCGRETFDDMLKMPAGSVPEPVGDKENTSSTRFLGGTLFVLDYGRVPERTFYFYDTRRDGKAGPMAEFKDPAFYIRKIFTDVQWQATNVRTMTLDCKRVGVYRYGKETEKADA